MGNLTVYAIWTHRPIVTCYNGDAVTLYTADEQGHIRPNLPDPRPGYKFKGWNHNGTLINTETYVFPGDDILHAEWEKLPVVTFDDLLGNVFLVVVSDDYTATAPALPPYQDHILYGWRYMGSAINLSLPIRQDIRVTAVWADELSATVYSGGALLISSKQEL